jgi:hypothetical protein
MKKMAGFLSVVFMGHAASAAVPYGALENLRRQSVVARVALDNPEDALVKNCGIKPDNLAAIGAKLALAMDVATEKWQKMSLQETDLAGLKSKIGICGARGSCQVYEKYLSSVKMDESVKTQAADLNKALNQKLEAMESASYKKALATVPEPCRVLKALLERN